MCGVAFALNVSTTHDLEWPAWVTQYRELAGAQTLLDVGYGPDSSYLDEYVWYNPLPAWLIAASSWLTGLPAPTVIPRLGPYINLLAPLGLFVLIAVLADRWAAMAGTAVFLFALANNALPEYASPGYSPWFLPRHFVQGLFYLTLAATVRARAFGVPGAPSHAVLLGGLLGVTFLGHTAPALLLGGIFACLAGGAAWRARRWRGPLRDLALSLSTALLVSGPFAFYIAWVYRFRVLNAYPGVSPDTRLNLSEALPLAQDLATTIPLAGAAGLLAYVWRRWRTRGADVLAAWVLLAVGLMLANYGRFVAAKLGLDLVSVVPPFHYLFYLQAVLCVGVGVGTREGADGLAVGVARLTGERRGAGARPWRETALPRALPVMVTLAVIAYHFPAYREREDFGRRRALAVQISREIPVGAWQWIRGNTGNDDVFLCTDELSLFLVTPAGRKVVATNRYFSSPYVDWVQRDRDRRAMFEQLGRGDTAAFRGLADKYRVTFVIVAEGERPAIRREAGLRPGPVPRADELMAAGYTKVYGTDGVAIFRIR